MAGRRFKLTLSQLAAEPLRLPPGTPVHVCENPAVVIAAEARLGPRCTPLVCTGGWPSSAADALLAELASHGCELRYHGDFDWEGVRIAALVARRSSRGPGATTPRPTAAHPGRVQALEGREPASGTDAELAAALRGSRGSLQEEAVLDELIEDLGPSLAEAE